MSKPITITIENGYYAVRFPFDDNLRETMKAMIHKSLRSWDGEKRAWIVSPKAIDLLITAITRSGYEAPDVPAFEAAAAIVATIQKTLTVEYIGQCKERDGVISALGSVKGYWSVEFPEQVLKDWFERRLSKDGLQTFYQVLCVFETASDQEITSAYRRLSRQWHPDVCQNEEDDPGAMFRKLTDAYQILREPQKRKRYDAGLFFEREARKKPESEMSLNYGGMFFKRKFASQHFLPPLRCGLITAEGTQRLSRFNVSKITAWDDITDGAGRVMTASWNKNRGPIDPYTGRPKGEIEIQWI